MPWFKIDDGFWSHPKVLELSPGAIGLWVRAGSWSAGQRTAGRIPLAIIEAIGAPLSLADELVDAGMWRTADGGYQFHEWRKHQDGDYRPNIPKRVRRAVFERDGYRCVFCGSVERLSLDHIVRYRDDGPDTLDNLRVLCMPCNTGRG